jgi:hypothetical protein
MHSSGIKQENSIESLLRDVYSGFRAEGSFLKGIPFGSGHIHDTFLAETDGPDNYIMQRLNRNVFRNIPEMQENIERVTLHIRNKLKMKEGADVKRECLRFLEAEDGRTWIKDSSGEFWRISIFITRHRSYDTIDSPLKAFEGGRAIGRFQSMLADFKGRPLHDTIPYFHNTTRRLETLYEKISQDPAGRAGSVKDEIGFVSERAEKMQVLLRLGKEGRIPVRITHNDTKFNNILLDENDRALCLIDLDTVMPGYVHYDFGDAMRTGSCRASEDEEDLSAVEMDMSLFSAFAEGYLGEMRTILNAAETEYLPFSPLVITFTQAVRFLSDYIDGDKYYKIHYPEQNLRRTRTQVKLIKSMERNYPAMQGVVKKLT